MNLIKLLKYGEYRNGYRTIFPEENSPTALFLTLTLNQTLTITVGQFSSVAIVRIPIEITAKFSRLKSISRIEDYSFALVIYFFLSVSLQLQRKTVSIYCEEYVY